MTTSVRDGLLEHIDTLMLEHYQNSGTYFVLLGQERRRSTGDRLLDCRVVEVESTEQG